MLGFLGQYRFITPLCEGLVSSGLDSIKKLATIHAKKKKKKKSLMSVNTRALQSSMFDSRLLHVQRDTLPDVQTNNYGGLLQWYQ